jgi:hypothetical protein
MADTNSTPQMRIFKDPTGNTFADIDFFTLPLPKHIPLLRHLYVSASAESSAHKNAESISAKDSLLVLARTRMPFCRGAKQGYESSDC